MKGSLTGRAYLQSNCGRTIKTSKDNLHALAVTAFEKQHLSSTGFVESCTKGSIVSPESHDHSCSTRTAGTCARKPGNLRHSLWHLHAQSSHRRSCSWLGDSTCWRGAFGPPATLHLDTHPQDDNHHSTTSHVQLDLLIWCFEHPKNPKQNPTKRVNVKGCC